MICDKCHYKDQNYKAGINCCYRGWVLWFGEYWCVRIFGCNEFKKVH